MSAEINSTDDLLDILEHQSGFRAQDILLSVKKYATDPNMWFAVDYHGFYGVVHGYTNLVESMGLHWVIRQEPVFVGQTKKLAYRLWVRYPKAKPTNSNPKAHADDFTEDEVNLCLYVGERVTENDWMPSNPLSPKNLKAARRLLAQAEKMGGTLEDICKIFDWAVEDEFWSQNIRSMSGFVKHFDQLRKKSQNNRPQTPRAGRSTRSDILEEARKRLEREATNA